MTDHINDKYIKVNLSLLVYVVRGLLERAPQAVFGTELTCLIISIIYGFRYELILSVKAAFQFLPPSREIGNMAARQVD